ncbi:hypothetical protein BCON_0031g00420 [Botryotinia convoluta]|uniref:Zn(2)-C6 fungal-type domain-containing protein n=1 Tax=Botryotinia convoluta TaxID=54673 RepID=A0A4Z1IKC8_9HELO|nr:hypothetical protein BCON_0031g00420 [Botryotinia convoluta]
MDISACGVSSRRFACDRCRGQKLRCIRERTNQESYDRCFRADAACRTSPVFRLRSYTDDTALASTNSIGEKARVQKSVRKRRYNNAAQLQRQSQVTTQQAVMDTAIVTETASPSVSLEQTALMNLFETSQSPSTMPMYSTDFSNTISDMHWAAEDSLFSGLILPDGTDQTFDLSGNSGTGSSTESYPSQAPTYTGDLPSRPKPSLILSPRTASSTSTSNLQNLECSSHKTLATISENNILYESSQDQVAGSISIDKNEEENIVKRLAKTNLDLVSLLSQINQGNPKAIVEMLVEPINEAKSPRTRLDDILNSTRDFLQSLSLLAGSSSRPSVSPPQSFSDTHLSSDPASNTIRPGHQKTHKNYANALSETDKSSTTSPADSSPSSTDTALSTSNTKTGPELDVTLLLLILTSYMHLLRLYEVLFSHIHGFLTEISDSDDPSLCPLPGLSIFSFPLQSGNLQTTILIQIITSLFEQIERLLDLPREYRIDLREIGPDGFVSSGLMSSEELVDIIKFVFRRQDSGQSECRRGGLEALREHLEGIKQLLKNRIAF